MKYAINIFNSLKASYNLAVFNTKKEAEESYKLLEDLWNAPDAFINISEEDLSEEELENIKFEDLNIWYNEAFSKSIAYEEVCLGLELDKNDILKKYSYTINDDGRVHTVYDNIKVLFNNESVTIPS